MSQVLLRYTVKQVGRYSAVLSRSQDSRAWRARCMNALTSLATQGGESAAPALNADSTTRDSDGGMADTLPGEYRMLRPGHSNRKMGSSLWILRVVNRWLNSRRVHLP